MPRLPRPVADGLLYHALNRGNNRAPVFFGPDDFRTFRHALGQTQRRYPFRLYGYCLMTNHFHLLLSPEPGQSVSRILQSLTVAHTWRCHRARATSGHVWQGRFKSPLVQHDDHALPVLRYVEANPLRAGMVRDLADYPWSSYPAHGRGQADALLSPLPSWLAAEADDRQRAAWWRQWVHAPQTDKEQSTVRQSAVSGRPFGDPDWTARTAAACGLALSSRSRGRPRKGNLLVGATRLSLG
jgi:putative transposase